MQQTISNAEMEEIHFTPPYSKRGFTLLEVLVALTILAVAVISIMQLFSANLKTISVSGAYVPAFLIAESKMQKILDEDRLEEKTWAETADEGYTMDVSIFETLKERTNNLQVKLFEIDLTIYIPIGNNQKMFTLKTMKAVDKFESAAGLSSKSSKEP
jgi:type II secretion system protein I